MKKCVILPSSIYDCDEAVKSFDERFTVFCRERQSYEYCKSLNSKAKFIMADDMAINADFSLYDDKFFNREIYKRFLSCEDDYIKHIRNNIFPVYQKVFYNTLLQLRNISDYNIGYIIRKDWESLKNFNYELKTFDLSSAGNGCFCDEALCYMLSKIFLSVINIFNVIVTDRLHAAICAAKLKKEVFLLDNSYKKNSTIYNYSLSKFENVRLISVENLETEIKQYKINNELIKTNLLEQFKKYNSLPISFKEFLLEYGSIPKEYNMNKRFI